MLGVRDSINQKVSRDHPFNIQPHLMFRITEDCKALLEN
jgi:hypothetical protein